MFTRLCVLCASAVVLSAQPVLRTELRNGVLRALVLHAETGEMVTDDNPAIVGEKLHVMADGMAGELNVLIGARQFPGVLTEDGHLEFDLPPEAGGSFVEISIESADGRSNAATIPARDAETTQQLTAAEVNGIVMTAMMSVDNPRLAVAVVDRAGRPLAIYRRPGSTDSDVEDALSLARTGAFFSHNEAPLSSRTVRFISTINFPEGIPNQPNAALYGIENTNRGCSFNTAFLPGKAVPQSTNAPGTGPSKGITTRAGGLPLYRNGDLLIGGIGAGGVPPDVAEFVTVAATFGSSFFVRLPVPPPGAVFIDGFRLPFVTQTTRPAGTQAASAPGGQYRPGEPRNGNGAPDEWLVGPLASATMTEAEVRAMVDRLIERANRTRAVIRLPLGTRAKFVFAVTDLDGKLLALYRMPDATIFSIDVAVAKARNVVYFSGENTDPRDRLPSVTPGTAYTNRTISFTAQPFFPPGILNSQPGPFYELFLYDINNPCSQGRQPKNANQNGIVFFPGAAPLYKGGRMVGGLGVSGDGVEQDDYVTAAGALGFEPSDNIRADQFLVQTPLGKVRLPYLKFPRNPEQ